MRDLLLRAPGGLVAMLDGIVSLLAQSDTEEEAWTQRPAAMLVFEEDELEYDVRTAARGLASVTAEELSTLAFSQALEAVFARRARESGNVVLSEAAIHLWGTVAVGVPELARQLMRGAVPSTILAQAQDRQAARQHMEMRCYWAAARLGSEKTLAPAESTQLAQAAIAALTASPYKAVRLCASRMLAVFGKRVLAAGVSVTAVLEHTVALFNFDGTDCDGWVLESLVGLMAVDDAALVGAAPALTETLLRLWMCAAPSPLLAEEVHEALVVLFSHAQVGPAARNAAVARLMPLVSTDGDETMANHALGLLRTVLDSTAQGEDASYLRGLIPALMGLVVSPEAETDMVCSALHALRSCMYAAQAPDKAVVECVAAAIFDGVASGALEPAAFSYLGSFLGSQWETMSPALFNAVVAALVATDDYVIATRLLVPAVRWFIAHPDGVLEVLPEVVSFLRAWMQWHAYCRFAFRLGRAPSPL